MTPRILLLQARLPNDPMAQHEVDCFVDQSGIDRAHLIPYDLLQGPPSREELYRSDALMVGGSGDFYVSKGDLPHWDAFLDFLRELVARGKPTFASCFGFQALVHALGGEIIHDPPNTEVGTFQLRVTEAGRADPLFGDLPDTFAAQMGHKDRATRYYDGVPNLASSELSPMQAFRIPGQPIWATQFHPELTRKTNIERFKRYMAGYSSYMSDEERLRRLDAFQDSPEASGLLRRFVDVIFGR